MRLTGRDGYLEKIVQKRVANEWLRQFGKCFTEYSRACLLVMFDG